MPAHLSEYLNRLDDPWENELTSSRHVGETSFPDDWPTVGLQNNCTELTSRNELR